MKIKRVKWTDIGDIGIKHEAFPRGQGRIETQPPNGWWSSVDHIKISPSAFIYISNMRYKRGNNVNVKVHTRTQRKAHLHKKKCELLTYYLLYDMSTIFSYVYNFY